MRKPTIPFILLAVILVLGICGGSWILANGPRRSLNQPCAGEDTPLASTPVSTPTVTPKTAAKPDQPAAAKPDAPEIPVEETFPAPTPQPVQPKPATPPPQTDPTDKEKLDAALQMLDELRSATGKLPDLKVIVSGTVADSTGNLVPDATVYAAVAPTASARARMSTAGRSIAKTDASGHFTCTFTTKAAENTRIHLVLTAGGNVWLADGEVRRECGNGDNISVALKVKAGASLRGRVVDHLGRGIEGATISVSVARSPARKTGEMPDLEGLAEEVKTMKMSVAGGSRASAASDANGDFVVQGVEPGKYRVKASAKGFSQPADQVPEVTLDAGEAEELPLPLRMTQVATLRLSVQTEDNVNPGSITAEFRPADSGAVGKPVFSRSASMAKDGSVTFHDISAGSYSVVIRTSSRMYKPAPPVVVNFVEGQAVELAAVTFAKDPDAKPYPKRGGGKDADGNPPGWGLGEATGGPRNGGAPGK